MSTTMKPKNVKKAKCKMASPVCPDRAEAFVGALAEVCPQVLEIPSERDAKAFLLASQGMTQREIAETLKISQPTVQRTLKKYRDWLGTTLPEDRGEMIGFPRFRVAVEERRVLLRHQLEMAMEEWQQSRQPILMKRTRTKIYPEGRKADGAEVKEVIIDEYVQRRNPSASHLNAAAKRSLELTMLEAGYLGVRQLSCDDAMDVDERDRWDRIVKHYKGTVDQLTATVEALTRKVAELEAKQAAASSRVPEAGRNARVKGEASVGRGSPDPAHADDRRSPGREGETFGPELRRGQETRAEPQETRAEQGGQRESRVHFAKPQAPYR